MVSNRSVKGALNRQVGTLRTMAQTFTSKQINSCNKDSVNFFVTIMTVPIACLVYCT